MQKIDFSRAKTSVIQEMDKRASVIRQPDKPRACDI